MNLYVEGSLDVVIKEERVFLKGVVFIMTRCEDCVVGCLAVDALADRGYKIIFPEDARELREVIETIVTLHACGAGSTPEFRQAVLSLCNVLLQILS